MDNFHQDIKKRLQTIRKEVVLYKLKEELKDQEESTRSRKYPKKKRRKGRM